MHILNIGDHDPERILARFSVIIPQQSAAVWREKSGQRVFGKHDECIFCSQKLFFSPRSLLDLYISTSGMLPDTCEGGRKTWNILV